MNEKKCNCGYAQGMAHYHAPDCPIFSASPKEPEEGGWETEVDRLFSFSPDNAAEKSEMLYKRSKTKKLIEELLAQARLSERQAILEEMDRMEVTELVIEKGTYQDVISKGALEAFIRSRK